MADDPLTITLSVYSHWDEILVTSEVPHNQSLFTAIAVNYPFARWALVQVRRAGVDSNVYDYRTMKLYDAHIGCIL
jgi:hypothetical protein